MLEALESSELGKIIVTLLVSMAPVAELRAGIPFGVALGLDIRLAVIVAIIGNLIPVPFILLFIRKIFDWMKKWDKTAGIVAKFEKKAHLKSEKVIKYQSLGLCILVAIPLPGTGAWTGALVAAILNMSVRKALPPIMLGVCIAAFIVTCLTYGVVAIFD